MEYIQRDIEPLLKTALRQFPVVGLYGPRQSGKTTLAKHLCPNFAYVNLENYPDKELAKTDPVGFFVKYPEPVIIDEVQEVPEITSQIQRRADERHLNGQYILTGSRQLDLKKTTSQTLAGRIATLWLLPLSLHELDNAGYHNDRDAQILVGCMPGMYRQDMDVSLFYQSYIDTFLKKDIMEQRMTDLSRYYAFLKMLAGRIGQLVNYSDIADGLGVSSVTIKEWISILENAHIINILQPWFPSRDKRYVKTPKVYFVDTGIACKLLDITSPDSLRSSPMLGPLFENLVVAEAFKSCAAKNQRDSLYFFRNNKGMEIDLLQQNGALLHAYEIKSGMTPNQEWKKSMLAIKSKYPAYITGEPTVIYAGESYPQFEGCCFVEFHHCWESFQKVEQSFVFHPHNPS
jgi:predicted AAA+ superfamily ATPase